MRLYLRFMCCGVLQIGRCHAAKKVDYSSVVDNSMLITRAKDN
jgi:hypothetical protein